jgi:septal ring factor EnvC (AmiA/AmiB activator)
MTPAQMQSFATAFASTMASSSARDTQLEEVQRQAQQLKTSITSIQKQLEAEREVRERLESKINVLMASLPVPANGVPISSSSKTKKSGASIQKL